ncbi:TPA: hypothetical protein ACKQC7_005067 [Serratia marcescens]|uniref:hypothetical protein n=1 Tax=Serratia marcescens TaxID=615 RepID=UPI001115476E|nr:hypothetical protein [Serratia marcescens]
MKELFIEEVCYVGGGYGYAGDPSKIGNTVVSFGAGAAGSAIGGLVGGPPGATIGGLIAGAAIGSQSEGINKSVGYALVRQLNGLSVGS